MKASQSAYDVVILGGGAAGCVTAARLAERDPSLKILLVEVGKTNLNDPQVQEPIRFVSLLLTDKVKHYQTEPDAKLPDNRSLTFAQGNLLGGGSSVNWMMYTRPAASDFQTWTSLNGGDSAWSFDKVLPYLKKSETYQVESHSKDMHGYEGPLKVSKGEGSAWNSLTEMSENFLASIKESGTVPISDDVNDCVTTGASHWRKWIDKKTGKRQDVPHHYIHPFADARKNLEVITEAQVVRLVLDDNLVATGAEIKDIGSGETFTVQASRQVVLSAGPLNSPGILERSGVGSKALLESLQIPVKLVNEGVGANFQDHGLLGTHFYADPAIHNNASLIWGAIFGFSPDDQEAATKIWREEGTGASCTNNVDVGVRYRPASEKEFEAYPAIKEAWKTEWADKADKPLYNLYHVSGYMIEPQAYEPGKSFFGIGCNTNYPAGRGSIHIRSTNPDDPPRIENPYMNNDLDVQVMSMGWKHLRRLARRTKGFRGEQAATMPKFREGSKAAAAPYSADKDTLDLPEPEYDAEDEKAIIEFVQTMTGSAWHQSCTLAQLPKDANGCVDSRLNFYGIKNLKVADMSITPRVPGGNTYSVAVMIGERAADIIAEDLHL